MAGTGQRIIDFDATFFQGTKSDTDPGQLPLGYAWMTMNMLNVGGVLSCRPGYDCIFELPDGNLQGAAIFRPQLGAVQMMFIIEGLLYVSDWPFENYRQISGIQFSPYARSIYWAQTVQAAERISSDLGSAIRVIPPKSVMMMTDGGSSGTGYYDGHTAGHITGDPYGTPSGSAICWAGDRLWVARENQLFASDIANPFSFREQTYLGGSSSFFFNSRITAMTRTPSIEAPQLMVFTESNASIVQADIRERNLWPTTADFQKEVLQLGATGQRSVVSHYGRVVWYSTTGVAFFDSATSGKLTSRLPLRDNEMLYSKSSLSQDLSQVATGAYGQFLLVSVPAEDGFNRHTWVMNHASIATLNDDSGPSWSGYWMGTRPVEWLCGEVEGRERAFHVSVDRDGKNRLWETFVSARLDNGCPITWAIWTRGYFGPTAAIQVKPPGARCRLAWTDISLAGIEEPLDLGVFYAPGTRGGFRQILSKTYSVERGCLAHDQPIDMNSLLYAFKPQSRIARTEDVNQRTVDDAAGSCAVESPDLDHIDQNFQLFIVGQGPCAVRWVRPFAYLVPEDLSGSDKACTDELAFNVARFDGYGVEADTFDAAYQELVTKSVGRYTSHQSVAIEDSGYTVVGVGDAESLISQRAADRVAAVIATRKAELDLQGFLPPVWSQGGLEPSFETPGAGSGNAAGGTTEQGGTVPPAGGGIGTVLDPSHSILTPLSLFLASDGISTGRITVQARDAQNNNFITGGAIVVFNNYGVGNITPVVDHGNGTYSVDFTAPIGSGTASITATINGAIVGSAVYASVAQITYGQRVSASNSSVTLSPSSVVSDGVATTTITVTVKDTSNNPIVGKQVGIQVHSLNGGSYQLTGPNALTDSQGRTTATLASTKAGVKQIIAVVDVTSITQQPTVTFTAQAVDMSKSNFVALPTTVPLLGHDPTNPQSNCYITVTLRDINYNGVPGQTVNIIKTGSAGVLSSVTDDQDGSYHATLQPKPGSSQQGAPTIKASVGVPPNDVLFPNHFTIYHM